MNKDLSLPVLSVDHFGGSRGGGLLAELHPVTGETTIQYISGFDTVQFCAYPNGVEVKHVSPQGMYTYTYDCVGQLLAIQMPLVHQLQNIRERLDGNLPEGVARYINQVLLGNSPDVEFVLNPNTQQVSQFENGQKTKTYASIPHADGSVNNIIDLTALSCFTALIVDITPKQAGMTIGIYYEGDGPYFTPQLVNRWIEPPAQIFTRPTPSMGKRIFESIVGVEL